MRQTHAKQATRKTPVPTPKAVPAPQRASSDYVQPAPLDWRTAPEPELTFSLSAYEVDGGIDLDCVRMTRERYLKLRELAQCEAGLFIGGLDEKEFEYLSAALDARRRDRGCATPVENFVERIVSRYGVDALGEGAILHELEKYRENMELAQSTVESLARQGYAMATQRNGG